MKGGERITILGEIRFRGEDTVTSSPMKEREGELCFARRDAEFFPRAVPLKILKSVVIWQHARRQKERLNMCSVFSRL